MHKMSVMEEMRFNMKRVLRREKQYKLMQSVCDNLRACIEYIDELRNNGIIEESSEFNYIREDIANELGSDDLFAMQDKSINVDDFISTDTGHNMFASFQSVYEYVQDIYRNSDTDINNEYVKLAQSLYKEMRKIKDDVMLYSIQYTFNDWFTAWIYFWTSKNDKLW